MTKAPNRTGGPNRRRTPRKRDAVFGKAHSQLTVVLPTDLVNRLKAEAEARDETLRVLILRALKRAGYPVDESDLADRRVEAAQRRSEIYRRGKGE
jgi:hypothetical protein